MKKLFNVMCAFAFVANANAQHFRWNAPVNATDSTGYTRILLQPEVTGELRAGYPDVRLYNSVNTEIPYFIAKDRLVQGTTRFVEYPVVGKHDAPGNSWVTVENPLYATDPLNQICLEVNNTEARRGMTLTGSYDNKSWYAIKDEFIMSYYESYFHDSSKTSAVVVFDFPLTDYRYFRFNFDNWTGWWRNYAAPVFVVRAGVLVKPNPASIPNQKMELPGVMYTTKQVGKTTAVDIVFDAPQYVDYLRADLSATVGAGTFHRGAKLYELDSVHNCSAVNLSAHTSATVLSSASLNEFPLYGHKVKHLCLHIDNEDDQPLRVNAVHAIQVKQYLVAFLEKGESYHLAYGSDSVNAPSYDLRYTADDLALHEMNVTGTGSRTALAQPVAAAPQAQEISSFFENKTAIWCAIAVVVLILGWMSVKMLREMKQQ